MTQEDTSDAAQFEINRRNVLRATTMTGVGLVGVGGFAGSAAAAIGDELGVVRLPGQQAGNDGPEGFTCSVGGTFDGTYYTTTDDTNLCASTTMQIYEPPASGDGNATLVSEKDIVDQDDNLVQLSAFTWDPSRDRYWGAYRGEVYLIDRGDPTDGSQDASAVFQFNTPETFADSLIDGLARDGDTDTLWISDDATQGLEHYQTDGTHIESLVPETDSNGNTGGSISGVTIGTPVDGRPTLYLGRAGVGEIVRVHADNGEFISKFAQNVSERVEDLSCDPVTYDRTAILAKDAYNGIYTALEVGEGTCPLSGGGVCDPAVTVDLIADGGSEATAVKIGSVTITSGDPDDDGDSELSVTYSLMDDWFLRETHLHVAGDDDEDGAGDCERIPQNRAGNPTVGQFGLSRDYGPGVQEDTYVIERDAADNVFGEEFSEGEALCIAAHASVFEDMDGDEAFDPDEDREETAWGDGERFTHRGNWAMHFDYQNPCVENPFPAE